MPVLGDSSAVLELNKMLPQHQSAITLLNSIVQNPNADKVYWLDLACGKGQIISQLSENLTLDSRRKIVYQGYDINIEYSKLVTKTASTLNFDNFKVDIGDLSSFDSILPHDMTFDYITCTNVTHEIHPQKFFLIIWGAIKRLNDNGQLFIYDMESLANPELGALPLKGADIKRVFDTILKLAGSTFKVSPSTWTHRTCKGWSLVINRSYLDINSSSFDNNASEILMALRNEIQDVLNKKLEECTCVLKTLTMYGTETIDEEAQKQMALYEFWALHKALEDLT